jgi:hypothetical protein
VPPRQPSAAKAPGRSKAAARRWWASCTSRRRIAQRAARIMIFYFHRCGEFFYGHGDEAGARTYLARLNERRTSNLYAMRLVDGDKPRGIDLTAELAKKITA